MYAMIPEMIESSYISDFCGQNIILYSYISPVQRQMSTFDEFSNSFKFIQTPDKVTSAETKSANQNKHQIDDENNG